MNVTHFQKYFASRWEIFYHSFMGMTANRTKTTSAIRCNGMSQKMKKCWLPNRYSVELCLEGTFFWLASLRCMFWSVRFHMQDEIRECMRKAKFFTPFVHQTIEKIQNPSKSLEHRIVVYWKFEIPIAFGVVIGCYVKKIGAIKFQFDIQ